jgi:hypothetical protein
MGYNRLTDGGVLSATQQNQNWSDIEALSEIGEGFCVLSGLTLAAGSGLSVDVAAGQAVINKLVTKSAETVTGLPASTTTYLWLRDDGVFTQTSSLSPPTGAHALLGSVTTGTTDVTGVDSAIAWKGRRVEDATKLIAGPNSLTVVLNAPQVGVGTDSPSDTLHVSGIARADAISLPERASPPTPVANRAFLYSKDDSGDTELFFCDDGGAEVQLTRDGNIAVAAYLLLAGGTMGGNVVMGGSHKLTGLAAGTANGDSVRYEQLMNHSIRTFGINALSYLQLQNTTRYYPLNGYRGPSVGNEAYVQVKMYEKSYQFKNLRVYVSANTTSASSTVKLRDDGADSSLVVTIGAGQTGSFENVSDTPTVDAGSLCNYSVFAGAGGTGSMTIESIQVDAVSS